MIPKYQTCDTVNMELILFAVLNRSMPFKAKDVQKLYQIQINQRLNLNLKVSFQAVNM